MQEKARREKKQQKILMEIKDRNEMLKYIKKQRQQRESPDEEIEEEWIRHFMKLLHGEGNKEERKEMQEGREEEIRREEKIIISEGKVEIKRLKKKKAGGEDNLKNEAWIYIQMEGKLREVLQKICDENRIPME